MKLATMSIIVMVSMLFIISCSLDEEADDDGGSNTSLLELYINEFLASNDAATVDPDEDSNDGDPYEDWFEIYNGGGNAIDIGGMYVSDGKDDITMYQIPSTEPSLTTIQPGDFLIVWCDKELLQGVLHVDFALGSGGEDIVLTESDGLTIVDQLTFEAQTTDISYGQSRRKRHMGIFQYTDSWGNKQFHSTKCGTNDYVCFPVTTVTVTSRRCYHHCSSYG